MGVLKEARNVTGRRSLMNEHEWEFWIHEIGGVYRVSGVLQAQVILSRWV